jgi:hypothetical protein
MHLWKCGTQGRNSDLYKCARIGVSQPQFPAKFFHPLAHSADANAARLQFHNWVFDPFAIISYHNHHMAFSLRKGDPRFLRSRMPIDIGESLLNDTEDGGLQLGSKSREVGWLGITTGS